MRKHVSGTGRTYETPFDEDGCKLCRNGVSPLDGAIRHESTCPVWQGVRDANLTMDAPW